MRVDDFGIKFVLEKEVTSMLVRKNEGIVHQPPAFSALHHINIIALKKLSHLGNCAGRKPYSYPQNCFV